MEVTGSRIRRAAAVVTLPAAVAVLAGCGELSALTHAGPARGNAAQTTPPPQAGPNSKAIPGARPTSLSASPAPSPAALPTPASVPSTSGYFQYYNRRFQFSFNVPDGYTKQAPPEDGDGNGFTNGTATVTGFGQNYMDSPDMTSEEDLASLVSEHQSSGDTITYQTADGDIAAVSGVTSQGQVFYQRDVVYPMVVYSLVWQYPYADKTQYAPLVDYTATTFTPGPHQTG